jgi:hypothetical protein
LSLLTDTFLFLLDNIFNVINIVDAFLSLKLHHSLHRGQHLLALLVYLALVSSIIKG